MLNLCVCRSGQNTFRYEQWDDFFISKAQSAVTASGRGEHYKRATLLCLMHGTLHRLRAYRLQQFTLTGLYPYADLNIWKDDVYAQFRTNVNAELKTSVPFKCFCCFLFCSSGAVTFLLLQHHRPRSVSDAIPSVHCPGRLSADCQCGCRDGHQVNEYISFVVSKL